MSDLQVTVISLPVLLASDILVINLPKNTPGFPYRKDKSKSKELITEILSLSFSWMYSIVC